MSAKFRQAFYQRRKTTLAMRTSNWTFCSTIGTG